MGVIAVAKHDLEVPKPLEMICRQKLEECGDEGYRSLRIL
jgi:hypothetical protein